MYACSPTPRGYTVVLPLTLKCPQRPAPIFERLLPFPPPPQQCWGYIVCSLMKTKYGYLSSSFCTNLLYLVHASRNCKPMSSRSPPLFVYWAHNSSFPSRVSARNPRHLDPQQLFPIARRKPSSAHFFFPNLGPTWTYSVGSFRSPSETGGRTIGSQTSTDASTR